MQIHYVVKVAIMQPYIFPYIGYFQLINAVDCFVFLDDAQFIKRGWINRNRILVNGESYLFTVPLENVTQNRLINETQLHNIEKWKRKFFRTIEHAYKNAPQFNEVYEIIKNTFSKDHDTVSSLAIESIKLVSSYLNLTTTFKRSSVSHTNKQLKGADRIINICETEGASTYINPKGGIELYSKTVFDNKGIALYFLDSHEFNYNQSASSFAPNLSIIDVLMYNDRETIERQMNAYNLN